MTFEHGSVPPLFASHFSIAYDEAFVRVAFGDQGVAGGPITWHTHLLMQRGTADLFVDYLNRCKAQREATTAVKN